MKKGKPEDFPHLNVPRPDTQPPKTLETKNIEKKIKC